MKPTPTKIICKGCKKEFVKPFWLAKIRKYCNRECFYKYHMPPNKGLHIKYNDALNEWRKKGGSHKKNRIKKICLQCGKKFEVYPYYKDAKFCSRKCMGIFRRNDKKFAETRRRAQKQLWQNPEYRERMLKHDGIFKKGHIPWDKGLTKETNELVRKISEDKVRRKKIGEYSKKQWENKEWREKIIKKILEASYRRPTKPEQKVIDIIEKFRFPISYTGNGIKCIGGFCPDFVGNNGSKKIIEINGDYWHKLPNIIAKDKRKLETYSKYGFNTLVLWESELNNLSEQQIVDKMRRFLNG